MQGASEQEKTRSDMSAPSELHITTPMHETISDFGMR